MESGFRKKENGNCKRSKGHLPKNSKTERIRDPAQSEDDLLSDEIRAEKIPVQSRRCSILEGERLVRREKTLEGHLKSFTPCRETGGGKSTCFLNPILHHRMKITVIYGTSSTEKSSTYNIAKQFLAELADGDPVTEFHLPRDMPAFCTGCFNCFSDTTTCPHYKYIQPIEEAMQNADLIIITAPVYVFQVPGQVKALLDHFGCRWMGHKPNPQMLRKQALVIITVL